jgi:DNA polymerase III epsilon subunit-like protein
LNLCIKPTKTIEPKAAEITKLDNCNLDHQSQFDEDVANIIVSFLDRLKKPICLIAHNGLKFDFPILKAEFFRFTTVLVRVPYKDDL